MVGDVSKYTSDVFSNFEFWRENGIISLDIVLGDTVNGNCNDISEQIPLTNDNGNDIKIH